MVERFEKFSLNFVVVPLWFIIIPLVFSYLSKILFSVCLEFEGNFVNGRNNSKYCDVTPLIIC